jgi:hypothetical protein
MARRRQEDPEKIVGIDTDSELGSPFDTSFQAKNLLKGSYNLFSLTENNNTAIDDSLPAAFYRAAVNLSSDDSDSDSEIRESVFDYDSDTVPYEHHKSTNLGTVAPLNKSNNVKQPKKEDNPVGDEITEKLNNKELVSESMYQLFKDGAVYALCKREKDLKRLERKYKRDMIEIEEKYSQQNKQLFNDVHDYRISLEGLQGEFLKCKRDLDKMTNKLDQLKNQLEYQDTVILEKETEIQNLNEIIEMNQKKLKESEENNTNYNNMKDKISRVIDLLGGTIEKDSQKKKFKNEEEMMCKICFESKIEIFMEPCGHSVSCVQCSKSLNKCPVCRNNVKSWKRIYFS